MPPNNPDTVDEVCEGKAARHSQRVWVLILNAFLSVSLLLAILGERNVLAVSGHL